MSPTACILVGTLDETQQPGLLRVAGAGIAISFNLCSLSSPQSGDGSTAAKSFTDHRADHRFPPHDLDLSVKIYS